MHDHAHGVVGAERMPSAHRSVRWRRAKAVCLLLWILRMTAVANPLLGRNALQPEFGGVAQRYVRARDLVHEIETLLREAPGGRESFAVKLAIALAHNLDDQLEMLSR
jgi:hypothetical protein